MAIDLRPPSISTPSKPAAPIAPASPLRPAYPPGAIRPARTAESFLSNYNDPYEINSFADVLLNVQAKKRKDYLGLSDIPGYGIFSMPMAAVDLLYNKTIKPIAYGKFGQAGLNLLVNLGETLDIMANPVKGLILEGWEGAVRGLGVGDRGRKNYDYNTGSWVLDLGLEIVSDPLNWSSLVGKALASNAAKKAIAPIMREVASEMAEQGGKALVKEATEEAFTQLAKRAAGYMLDSADETWGAAVKKAAEVMSRTRLRPSVEFTKEFIQEISDTALYKMTMRNLESLQKIVTRSEAFEKLLTKGALATSYGMVWWAGKRGFDWVYEFVAKRTQGQLKPLMNPFGTFDISNIDEINKQLEDVVQKSQMEMGAEGLNDSLVSLFWKEDIQRNLNNVEILLKKHGQDVRQLRQALKLYFEHGHKMSMEGYIKTIEKMSIEHGNIFDDLVNRLSDIYDDVTDANNTVTQALRNDIITGQQDHMDRVMDVLNPVEAPKMTRKAYYRRLMQSNYTPETEDVLVPFAARVGNKRSPIRAFLANTDRLLRESGVRKREDIWSQFTADRAVLEQMTKEFVKTSLGYANGLNPVFGSTLVRIQNTIEELTKIVEDRVIAYLDGTTKKINFNNLWEPFKRRMAAIHTNFNRVSDELTKQATETLRDIEFFDVLDDIVKEGTKQSNARYDKIMAENWDKWDKVFADADNAAVQDLGSKTRNFVYNRKVWSKLKGEIGQIFRTLPGVLQTDDLTTQLQKWYQTFQKKKIVKQSIFIGNALITIDETSFKKLRQQIETYYYALNNPDVESYVRDGFVNHFSKTLRVSVPELEQIVPMFNKKLDEIATQYIDVIPLSEAGFVERFENFLTVKTNKPMQTMQAAYRLRETLEILSQKFPESRPVFKPFLDILNKVPAVEIEPIILTIQADEVLYKLKLSQLYTNLRFFITGKVDGVQVETLNIHMAQLLNTQDGFGAYLYNLRQFPDTQELAERIHNHLINYRNYKEFVESIFRLSENLCNRETQLAFLDTLQNYARFSVTEMDEKFDYYMWVIFKKMEEQISTIHMNKSLSLENLIETEPELEPLRKMLAAKKLSLHTAGDDVKVTREIHRKILAKNILDDPDTVYMYWDIETNGLNSNIDPVLEISWAENLGGVVQNFAQAKTGPSNYILNKFFPDEADKLAAYYTRFGKDQSTEAQILMNFIGRIIDLRKAGKTVILTGHNIKGFDINFIKTRLAHLALEDAAVKDFIGTVDYLTLWHDVQILDTLKLLKEKEGYTVLAGNQKEVLTRITKRYLDRQLEELPDTFNRQFIQPVTGKTAQDFLDLGKTVQELTETTKELAMGTLQTNMADALRTVGGRIYQVLRDIGQENKIHSTYHISKTFLSEHPSGYMNSSKWLYEGIEGVRTYAVKKTVNFNAIMEYFTFNEGDTIEMGVAKFLTGTARAFDNMLTGLKNLKPIEPYESVIKSTLQVLKQAFPTFRTLRYLRMDKTNLAQNWVMLQYIINRISTKKINLDFLNKIPGFENIRPYLMGATETQTKLLYQSVLEETASTLIGMHKYLDYDFDLVYTDPVGYYTALEELYEQKIKSLKELNRFLDEQNAYRVSVQKINAALEVPVRLLKQVQQDLLERPEISRKIYMEHLQEYAQKIQQQQVYQILNLDPDTLYRHLYHNALGVIQFDAIGYLDQEPITKALKNLWEHQQEFEAKGIGVFFKDTRVYFVLKDTSHIPDKYIVPELDFSKIDDSVLHHKVVENLRETRQILRELSDNAVNGTFGDLTNRKFYETVYANLPEDVRRVLPEDYVHRVLNTNEFLEGVRFNHTNLGLHGSRKKVFQYASGDAVRTYLQTAQILAMQTKTELQYLQLYFHNSFSINTSPLFKTLSDAELLEMLQKAPEYRLVALIEDVNTEKGYRVISIKPNNLRSIELAKRLDAVVLPTQTYSKLVSTINENKFKGKLAQTWHRILYAYKAGYLMTVGAVMRNNVDGLIKNLNLYTGDTKLSTIYTQTFSLYHKYRECIKDMIDMGDNRLLTFTKYNEYFAGNPKLDKATYDLIHDFMEDGPSAGEVTEMVKYYKQRMVDKGKLDPDEIKFWNTFVETTNLLMQPNREVEQIHRLALYFMLLEQGGTQTEVFYQIAKTHFDYGLKTKTERYLELVFPFYTFGMRNLEYWVDMFMNNGWMPVLYRDVMTPIWNFDDYDYNEYSRNMSLQYQILSGNVPLSESGLTLKLNPSFMDAFNMLTNPIDAVNDRLAAPIKAIWQIPQDPSLSNIINTVPIAGSLYQRLNSGLRNMKRTGSIWNAVLPSVLGATLRWEDYDYFTRRSYHYSPYAKRPYKYYPKTKRTYHRKTYAKKNYGQRYYPDWPPYVKKSYYKKLYLDPAFRVPRVRVNNFYKDLYTTTGKTRFKSRLLPVTSKTLQYRIRDMANYMR